MKIILICIIFSLTFAYAASVQEIVIADLNSCDADNTVRFPITCFKLIEEGHHCNSGGLAASEGQLQVFNDDGSKPDSPARCFELCNERQNDGTEFDWEGNTANSFHFETDGTPRCFCNKNNCDDTYRGASSNWDAYGIYFDSECRVSGMSTTATVDTQTETNECYCDVSNNFYKVDDTGACTSCSNVIDSTGQTLSDNSVCECDFTSNFVLDENNDCTSCSSVENSAGTVVTISDQSVCQCDNDNDYYHDISGLTCLNQIYIKNSDGGPNCKMAFRSSSLRTLSSGSTLVELAMEALRFCGTQAFEIDTRFDPPQSYCYSVCEPIFVTPARDVFQVGRCNFGNSVQVLSGNLTSSCMFCDSTKGLISTNGVCSCDEGKGISNGVCSNCGAREKQSVDGLKCVCNNDELWFGEPGNCQRCNDDTVNTLAGNELCSKTSDWQYTIVSSTYLQDLQNSLATLGSENCPLA